jgi:hypothetical protein
MIAAIFLLALSWIVLICLLWAGWSRASAHVAWRLARHHDERVLARGRQVISASIFLR